MTYLDCSQGGYDCVIKKIQQANPSNDQTISNAPQPSVSAKSPEPSTPPPTPDANPYCERDWGAPDAGVKICWQHADNGSCKKWRQDSNGRVLPNDIYGADDSFSDLKMNVVYAQPCPEQALPSWFVIAGSWPPGEPEKLNARLNLLSTNGIRARVVKTDDYPKLRPGLFAVVLGPFRKDQAQARLITVQASVPDAFIKEAR